MISSQSHKANPATSFGETGAVKALITRSSILLVNGVEGGKPSRHCLLTNLGGIGHCDKTFSRAAEILAKNSTFDRTTILILQAVDKG